MRNHVQLLKWLIIILLIIFLCLFSACQDGNSAPQFTSQITETIPARVTQDFTQEILNKYRPAEAALLPDFSTEIQDIRFSVKPREHVPQTTGIDEIDVKLQNQTYLQIYYGYYSNGKWYDIPCENYELKGIFNIFRDDTGFDAAGDSHIVKIGPYLLVCVRHYSMSAPKWATFCTIKDTIGSESVRPFDDYYTPADREPGTHGFGYFKEDISSLDSDGHTNYLARDTFDQYYYVVLDYKTLPENYKLTVTYWEGLGSTSQTLTYDEIMALIEPM